MAAGAARTESAAAGMAVIAADTGSMAGTNSMAVAIMAGTRSTAVAIMAITNTAVGIIAIMVGSVRPFMVTDTGMVIRTITPVLIRTTVLIRPFIAATSSSIITPWSYQCRRPWPDAVITAARSMASLAKELAAPFLFIAPTTAFASSAASTTSCSMHSVRKPALIAEFSVRFGACRRVGSRAYRTWNLFRVP